VNQASLVLARYLALAPNVTISTGFLPGQLGQAAWTSLCRGQLTALDFRQHQSDFRPGVLLAGAVVKTEKAKGCRILDSGTVLLQCGLENMCLSIDDGKRESSMNEISCRQAI
jgi:hypothetical protein